MNIEQRFLFLLPWGVCLQRWSLAILRRIELRVHVYGMDDCVWVTSLGVYRLYDRAVIVEMNEYIIYIYIYCIYPKLRILNCPSGTGKGAGPF